MAGIEEIVEVIISRENSTVTQAGFGTLLILGTTETGIGAGIRVRNYLTLTGVAEDFGSSDVEYLMAQKAFSGVIKPSRIAIGYQSLISTPATSGTAIGTLDSDIGNWTIIVDGSLGVTIDSTSIQDLTGLDFNAVTDLDDIVAIIDGAVTGGVVTQSGGLVLFTSDTTGSASSVTLSAGTIGTDLFNTLITNTSSTQGIDTVSPETISEALDSVRDIDDDWYALVISQLDSVSIQESATYIQGLRKINFSRSSDSDILNPSLDTDIASVLKDASTSRTALIFQGTEQYSSSAWAGQYLPYSPGTLTWAHKALQGVTTDKLSESEKLSALGKLCNTYTTIGGRNITQWGTTSNLGDYIDIIRSIDFLEARIQEAVFGRLVASLKIPYDDAGFAIIASEIEGVLANAELLQIINAGWTVSVPRLEDVPSGDVANRHFSGLTFDAVLSGAIHTARIRGFLV